MDQVAVITGDIKNFTALEIDKRQKFINQTALLFKSWVSSPEDAEIFRGDSFQLIFKEPKVALYKGIQAICWFIQNSELKNNVFLSSRISIGIGSVAYIGNGVLNSDGEAFHLSGRNFDEQQDGELIGIHLNDQNKDRLLQVLLVFINKLIIQWNKGQAEVIYLILENKTQQQIGEQLKISQSSVNSRLKTSQWKDIAHAFKYIEDLIQTNAN